VALACSNGVETFDVTPGAPSLLGHVSNSNGKSPFHPAAVDDFEEAGLNSAIVEGLVLKFLVNCGMAAGRRRGRYGPGT